MSQVLAKNHGGSIVPGVSPAIYSQADFDRIAALIGRESGIVLSDGKRMLAYSRLSPLLRRNQCITFAEYLSLVENDADLLNKTVAALTTNHTYFNREPHHFDHFCDNLRTELVTRLMSGGSVRIWSAGSSSGEEIWTLLSYFLGRDKAEGRRIASKDLVVLASDLADHAIAAGKAATYASKAVEPMPEELRSNWTRAQGDERVIVDEMRNLVRFRQLNLLGDWPLRSLFDVIFCRNVMIYFDNPTKERLVARFAQQLQPGGYLYIGHSERVSGPAARLLEPCGPTVYRRVAQ